MSFDVQRESSIDSTGEGAPMERSMRSVYEQLDWSATALGPRDSWPGLLRLLVDLCLDSEFPVQISWGPELLVLYNDAYIPLLGAGKHPWALGRPASEVGPHLWPASEQHLREVMQTGRPYHSGDQRLIINRHGYPEEAYFTFSLSAIRDTDGTIVGLFNAITETTQHLLYQRRLQVLRRLGAVSITADVSVASTCRAAVEVIGKTRESVPFLAVFLQDHPGQPPRRVAGYGFDDRPPQLAANSSSRRPRTARCSKSWSTEAPCSCPACASGTPASSRPGRSVHWSPIRPSCCR